MGVRYYMATSAQAIAAARGNPDLTEVATSGPWVIFEVADSELVEPLENEPAVLEGVDDSQHEWVCASRSTRPAGSAGPAVSWFLDPTQWDVLAGPQRPRRVAAGRRGRAGPRRCRSPTSRCRTSRSTPTASPSTSTRSGTPVLVKASYFPNWQVVGAPRARTGWPRT